VSCSITFQFGGIKINGAEQSKTVTKPATPGKVVVIVSGSVKSPFRGTRHVVLAVGGFSTSAAYTATATSAQVAAALAAGANVSNSPVIAAVSGSQLKLTSKVTGLAGNLAYSVLQTADFSVSPSPGSLAGGGPAVKTTEYDSGSVDATVGTVAASTSWGKGSTPGTIASSLAASLNTAGNGAFTATASGASVTIVPTNKSSSKPNVTASVRDKMGFQPVSFAASTN